jgi:hypothetical protein
MFMGYKKITKDELEVFLRKHKLWLIGDPKGERANLTNANLSGANLYKADLTDADLIRADLTGANLTNANLYRADLTNANLYRADLTNADLTNANLYRADLTNADLTNADLTGADLSGADLYRANLTDADLTGANLYKADLTGANLIRANLTDANLIRADLSYSIACPEKGSFVGFKKVRGGYIVELEIPEDALRCSATSRKCRCDKAKVIAITNEDGSPSGVKTVYSKYDISFAYTVGEIVSVDNFDHDRWHECAPGIHFFITRQEAVNYYI